MKMLVMTMMLSREVMGEEHLEAVPVDKLPPPKVPLQVASHHCHSSDNCAPQKIISLITQNESQVAEHTGAAVGSLDDSLQNCLSLAPKQVSYHRHRGHHHHQSKIAFHSCVRGRCMKKK